MTQYIDTQFNDTQYNDTLFNVTKYNDTQYNDTQYNDTGQCDLNRDAERSILAMLSFIIIVVEAPTNSAVLLFQRINL